MKKLPYLFIVILLIGISSCEKKSTAGEEPVSDELSENTDGLADFEEVAESSKAVSLSEGDIEKFIKTFRPIIEELDQLGDDFGNSDSQSLAAIFASSEVKDILDKYGWDNGFMTKYLAITNGYLYLKMEESINNVPVEERAATEAVLKMSMEGFLQFVSDDNVEKIRPFMEDLDPVFEEM